MDLNISKPVNGLPRTAGAGLHGPPRLLKPAEAAQCLAISERKLWGLTNRGEIPCVRIDRLVRYDPRDLATWIESQKSFSPQTSA
jgi:predicted DNA-binding transcriptional regulator AlpA